VSRGLREFAAKLNEGSAALAGVSNEEKLPLFLRLSRVLAPRKAGDLDV